MHVTKNSSVSLRGTARFAEPDDIRAMGYLNGKGVVIGGLKKKFGGTTMLRHDGPEHVMVIAPARAGKGMSVVLPTLLTWSESTIVLDIRGENYARTSGWRASQGQNVFRFEPSAPEGSARYNPLAEIRIDTGFQTGDCQTIARSFQDDHERDAFWWLSAVILHVLYRVRNEDKRKANLADVYSFLCNCAVSADDKKQEEDAFEKLLLQMESYEHGNGEADKQVRGCSSRMRNLEIDERIHIFSSALDSLAIFADPDVARNTSTSDFTIKDLMSGEQPSNVYLVLSPAYIGRVKKLMRVILNQMLMRLTTTTSPCKHRLLLMLDEFLVLGKLDNFESTLAIMADFGLKAFLSTHDFSQLHAVYTRDENIMSNCRVRIAYAPSNIETARALSEMTGKTTLVQRKRSLLRKLVQGKTSKCASAGEISRPLMAPDECMLMPGLKYGKNNRQTKAGNVLIFTAGKPTICSRQFLYFQDKELNARSGMEPSGNIKDGVVQ